ncbi:MAG: hypothetical protein QW667_05450 [Candidatus Bathyarchaeia archaeon]
MQEAPKVSGKRKFASKLKCYMTLLADVLSKMKSHLILQPFDHDYDFLEEISVNSTLLFKIRKVEILPRKNFPETLLLSPRSLLAKFLMKKKKMVYLDDLMKELRGQFSYNLEKMVLAIIPHFILGFGENFIGLTLEHGISIVSTYGLGGKYFSKACVGISLHEIGHNLGLKHCGNKDCLMKAPCKPKNFHKGTYQLCKDHERILSLIL